MRTRNILFICLLVLISAISGFAQRNPRDEGITLYHEGKYEKAVELLEGVLEANDKNRLAWIYLGASFVHLKESDKAIKAFLKTNFVDKANAPVYDRSFKITSRPHAKYTAEARRNNTAGNIKVAIELRSDGKVGFVFPFVTLQDGLTESAVNAAKGIRFDPAVQNGVPITVVTIFEYNFATY
jgi:tetratricopeptide (TPR) repeat protein